MIMRHPCARHVVITYLLCTEFEHGNTVTGSVRWKLQFRMGTKIWVRPKIVNAQKELLTKIEGHEHSICVEVMVSRSS
jgi:hypothetical protein